MSTSLQVFASVHEEMRGPLFDDFARGLGELEADVFATGGTADALRELGLEPADATDLIDLDGLDATDLPRPVVAGILGGLIAAGQTELDLVVSSTRPPDSNHARDDFGGPTYQLGAIKAGIPVVSNPFQYQPVMRWLRAGRPSSTEMVGWLSMEAHQECRAFHTMAATVRAVGNVGLREDF